ncbi:MAG TPA: carbohydrate-binding protein [Bacteroidales bacterium]|jgi:hypothetical protein|nr:carbohydrate-binding protein [Bacteroidales bacterium]
MKKKYLLYPLGLLFIAMIAGCDDYAQKPIQENIYVNQKELDLFVGETVQLTASPTDGTYTYTWSSDNPEVATVTSNGLVEAVGEGFANIIVKSGELSTKVPLNAIIRIPLKDVIISETLLELYLGHKKTILVKFVPEDVNDLPTYNWRSEDPSIATVDLNGEITAVGEGITHVVYKIGDIEKRIKVDAATTRAFKGPHVISAAAPYVLMAADFDFGGPGNAFYDTDASDSSGQNGNYRKSHGDENSTGVDIEGWGNNVGWTNPGEWLLYTIEVQDAGDYLVEAQVAVPGSGSFHLELDNVNFTGTIGVPNTGGWGAFIWLSTPRDKLTVNLTKGRHKIKYYFEGGHNFRALRFTKQ